jgi:hypothetical protein
LNAGIVDSNPTEGMDICLCLFYVCIGSGLAVGLSPVQGVLPTVSGYETEVKQSVSWMPYATKREQQEEREREENWKGCGRKWSCPNFRHYSAFSGGKGGTEETKKCPSQVGRSPGRI